MELTKILQLDKKKTTSGESGRRTLPSYYILVNNYVASYLLFSCRRYDLVRSSMTLTEPPSDNTNLERTNVKK